MSTIEPTLGVLVRALAGCPVEDAPDAGLLIDLASRHGVGPLLAETPLARSLPSAAAARLMEDVRLGAIHAAVLDEELRRVLAALNEDGIHPVVIKGAHLSRTLYPTPRLRPRSDTDVLIETDARTEIVATLVRCGYRPTVHVRGAIILGQFHFERRDRAGIAHNLDVHWRVAAPLVLDRALPARAVFDASGPFPAAGAGARAPSLPHALAIACLHLAGHHLRAPNLLWLYDLHLLAAALSGDEREAFCAAAASGGYCAIAAHVLRLAHGALPLDHVAGLAEQVAVRQSGREASAALLRDRRRPLDDLLLDLRLAGWKDGVRLVREHVLPDPSYMRAAFSERPLAIAYARRALRGLGRWVKTGVTAHGLDTRQPS